MTHLVDIERACVFALLSPETSRLATTLASGLAPSAFSDVVCRVCFACISSVKAVERGAPDCARRYALCWRACGIMRKVDLVEDPLAELGVSIPRYRLVAITDDAVAASPAFVHEGLVPGDLVYEEDGALDTSQTVSLNPVDHLFQTAQSLTEEHVANAFSRIRKSAARG